MTDRQLPHDLQAERAILGAILVKNEALATVAPMLKPGDFYRPSHGGLYTVMLDLGLKHAPIDLVTLSSRLRSDGTLDDYGGPVYLSSLADGIPRSANIESYAKIVKDKATLRGVIKASSDAMQRAYDDPTDVDGLVDSASRDIFRVGEQRQSGTLVPMSKIVAMTLPLIEQSGNNQGRMTGLPTGFHDLDKWLGGLRPGQMITVAARPGCGKSSFMVNVASYLAVDLKKHVAMFSLEMSKEELCIRQLSSVAQVDGHRMMRGTLFDTEYRRLSEAMGIVSEASIHVDDSMAKSAFELLAKCRAMKASVGLDAVFVDYLQLMEGDSRAENRQVAVAGISRGLKALAKELGVPVIVLSQLSRQLESRKDKRPMLSDLRESGAIEQDSDVVMFLYRDEVYYPTSENKGLAEIIVAKQRNGPIGTIGVLWVGEQTRFVNKTGPEMF